MTVAESTRRNEQQFDLLQAVEAFGWRKLPFDCMRECGSAALTLAGLMREMKGNFFHRNSSLAQQINVPERTMKRHLAKLAAKGWIESYGRQKSESGRTRRTATRRVSHRARNSPRFGVLPRYLNLYSTPLKWSEIAVYSVVIGRAFTLHRTFQHAETPTESLFELADYTERFYFSVNELREKTGLNRQAIADAKIALHERHLIEHHQEVGFTDQLFPSLRSEVKSWDSSEGSFWRLEFKSDQ